MVNLFPLNFKGLIFQDYLGSISSPNESFGQIII